jgi:hypothetical protein
LPFIALGVFDFSFLDAHYNFEVLSPSKDMLNPEFSHYLDYSSVNLILESDFWGFENENDLFLTNGI